MSKKDFKLLIVSEASIDEISRSLKMRGQNSITVVKAALSQAGLVEDLNIKAYSKTDKLSAQDIKNIYMSGDRSVIFKVPGTEDEFTSLEVILSLSDIDGILYDFPDEETLKASKAEAQALIDLYNQANLPICIYWRFRSRRDANHLSMSDEHFRQYVQDVAYIREKTTFRCTWDAERAEMKLFETFKLNKKVPKGISRYSELNKFIHQISQCFDIPAFCKGYHFEYES